MLNCWCTPRIIPLSSNNHYEYRHNDYAQKEKNLKKGVSYNEKWLYHNNIIV